MNDHTTEPRSALQRFAALGALRRWGLLTVAALGGLVCVIGGSVLVAALQDTARTGTNSAESVALAASADIQLATATESGGAFTCGAFAENLSSGLFTLTGVSSGFTASDEHFCIKNVGSQPVTVSGLTDELADVDFACTGDETLHGDTSCGGDGIGELSAVLIIQYLNRDCETGEISTGGGMALRDNVTAPLALETLASGATRCVSATIWHTDAPAADVQKAQSDRATWRFKFTGQA